MYPSNLDSYRDRRAQNGRQKQRRHPRRRIRRWPFFLLSVLIALLIVAFFIVRDTIATNSDQLYVRPNTTFVQVIAGPYIMAPTITRVHIIILDNKGEVVKEATCYADANSRPGFVYERHSVTWLESLLGYHAGIKLLQVVGCAPQLNCLLHPKVVCITTINAVDNPQDQITTGSLPFGIPETGKGRVNYNIVTTQDGFAVSSQN